WPSTRTSKICAAPSEACSFHTSFCHHSGGAMNRFANARIGAAAAKISCHRLVDVVIRGPWLFEQQHSRAHQLSRLAVPALRHIFGNPSSLQWMAQISGKALDGSHFLARG